MKLKNIFFYLLFAVLLIPEAVFADEVTIPAPTNFRVEAAGDYYLNFIVDYDSHSQDYDGCEIQYADNRNYTNAKTVTITNQQNQAIEGLRAKTLYFLRARYVKDGKPVSSYTSISFKTADKMPSTSINNPVTKALTSKMKKGRSFVYNFPNGLDPTDAEWYIRYLCYGLPQYDYYTVSFSQNNCLVTQVKMTYNKAKAKKAKKINKKMKKIIKKAKREKGVKARVISINEQLCRTCSYDYRAYRFGQKRYPNAYEAYGCLVQHKAVCDGYTKAFYAIAKEMKIPVAYLSGDGHAWNKVKVKGKWYFVDVSGNDAGHRYKKRVMSTKHIKRGKETVVLY